jgi:NTP pyrophosphatase (non-canonical NTP hydrolase)
MDFNTYGKQALTTRLSGQSYGEISPELMDAVLGLVGESGEVAEKFKKLIRDKAGALSGEDKTEIVKELGDILWYINSVSESIGSSLEEVAAKNVEKIMSRKERGVSRGDGDNR